MNASDIIEICTNDMFADYMEQTENDNVNPFMLKST